MSGYSSILNQSTLDVHVDDLTIGGLMPDSILATDDEGQLKPAILSSGLTYTGGVLGVDLSGVIAGVSSADANIEAKTTGSNVTLTLSRTPTLRYVDFAGVGSPDIRSLLATSNTGKLISIVTSNGVQYDFNDISGIGTISLHGSPTLTGLTLSGLSTNTLLLSNGSRQLTSLPAGSSAEYLRGDNTYQTLNTSVVPESGNLYYTDARFDTRLATRTTTNLTEGSNLYYTDARFDTRLATRTTTNLTEGSNLYYTDARARAALSAGTGISYNSGTGVISTSGLVTSITGTANQITASAATGAVTLSVPSLLQITDLRLGKAAFNRPVTSNIISFGSNHQAAGGFTCVNFDTSHFIGSTTTSGGGLLVNARCGFVCPDGTGGSHTAVVIGGSKSGTGTPATATGLNVSCPALGATIGVGVIADSVSIGTGVGWTDATTASGGLRVSGAIGVGVNPGSSSIRINALTANTLVTCDANKELVSLAVGTTSQYLRGDNTYQTLNQAAVTGLTTASTPSFAGVNLGSGSINLSNYDTTTGANGLSYGGGVATVTWRIVRIGGMCFFSWANIEMPFANNTISIATATLTPTSAFLPSTTRSYTFTTPNVNGTGALYIGNLSLTVSNTNITIAWRPNGFDSSHKWWNNGSTPIINSGSVCYHIL